MLRGRVRTYDCDNNVDLIVNEISRQRRQPIVVTFRPAVFDRQVFALDIAGFLQGLTECCQHGLARVG